LLRASVLKHFPKLNSKAAVPSFTRCETNFHPSTGTGRLSLSNEAGPRAARLLPDGAWEWTAITDQTDLPGKAEAAVQAEWETRTDTREQALPAHVFAAVPGAAATAGTETRTLKAGPNMAAKAATEARISAADRLAEAQEIQAVLMTMAAPDIPMTAMMDAEGYSSFSAPDR
jgi:hypothetical protein